MDELRKQAESLVEGQTVDLTQLSPQAVQELFHELRVHQIELEMQNQELLSTQAELEVSRKNAVDLYEKYLDLYDFAPIGYCTLEKDGTIREMNLTAAAQLGRERDLLLKTRFQHYIAGEDQETFFLHLRKAFAATTSQSCELRLLKKDGSQFYVQVECAPVLNTQEHVLRVRFAVSDITELKRAESHIRSLNEELELRVKQRTAELERAHGELKDFIHVISHDLQTPLRGINHLSHWFLEDYAEILDEQGRELTVLLGSQVQYMNNLITALIKYSKVGRSIEYEEALDMSSLVREVVKTFTLPEHIQVTFENPLPVIRGDKIRLFQVFQNLIGNAAKCIEKSEGEISIGCQEDGAHWRFSVRDNGSGIDPKQHEMIFKIFQTDRPYDASDRTGIGLSLVKKIVESHGGKIWLESEPSQGSIFFFTLPKVSQ